MKNLLKNITLFVLLVVTFSAFTACNNTGASKATETSNEKTTDKAEVKSDDKKTKNDGNPLAPKAILSADIELLDGGNFKLEEKKGKVVLINLWAIWCGPCINEMPHFNEMQEKYKDKGFIVLGLNTGNDIGEKEKAANIEKFVEKQSLNYTIGYSDRKLTTEFFQLGRMNGIPQSFLINREGKLMGIFQGGSDKVIYQMKNYVEKVVNES